MNAKYSFLTYTVTFLYQNSFSFWFFVLCFAWLAWYYVKFTVIPILRPNDPKELPYFVPFLGSAIAYHKDSHSVINNGRKYSHGEPFALVLGGTKFYILTNARDVSDCYKNLTTLSFDLFVKELMLNCGCSKSCVDKMCQEPPPYIDGSTTTTLNPSGKSIARVGVDFHHTQLHPGPGSKLDDLTGSMIKFVNEIVVWDKVRVESHYLKSNAKSAENEVQVSLMRFCGKVLIEASTASYFGEAFLDIEPELLDIFYTFDLGMWKLLYNYPRWICRDVHFAKDRLVAAMAKHFHRPQSERPGEAWFTKALEEEQRRIGLTEEEMAATVLIIYFALNANTYKLSFWIFSYLLYDPSLMESIRAEVVATMPDGKLNMNGLMNSSPHLNSLIDEVLRLTTNSISVRFILEDTQLAGKTFRKGNRIMMPYRQLHEKEDVYGTNAAMFDPDRFAKDATLRRSPCFKPFGGGSTWCPGRFAARQETAAFIALALYRFDLSLVKNSDGSLPRFPRLEGAKPCFGMMGTVDSDDLTVRIRYRK